jgi:hypothetical protein
VVRCWWVARPRNGTGLGGRRSHGAQPTDAASDSTGPLRGHRGRARGPAYDTEVWYDQPPTPGEIAPSVIAGHLDSARNGPSVFYCLGAPAPGDPVRIVRADGSVVTFTVTDVRRYAQAQFPTDEVYGDLDRPGLRLITCGGELDPETRHYLDDTVVFAGFAAFDPRPDAE